MPIGAMIGIGAASSIAGSAIAAHGASKAADAQVQAAEQAAQLQHQDTQAALDFQKQQYGNSLQMMNPYLQTGYGALDLLRTGLGIPGASPQGFDPFATTTSSTNPRPGFGNGSLSPGAFPPGGFGNPGATDPNLGANGIGNLGPRFSPLSDGAQGSGFSRMAALRSFGDSGDPNAGINPGASTTPFTNPDAHNFGTGGTVTASTNQGGTGQVPITNPGAAPGGPAAGGVSADGNPNIGFGSLLTPFSEKFTAPTDVTQQNDPGWQFRLNTGLDSLQNSAAARGGLLSGGTAKALNDYAQNSASNEYSNVYNRQMQEYLNRYNISTNNQTNQFNKLAAISGMGQTSANNLSTAGLNSGNSIANTLLTSGAQIGGDIQAAGNARGSGYLNSGNILGNSIGNLGNLAMLYQYFNKPSGPTATSA